MLEMGRGEMGVSTPTKWSFTPTALVASHLNAQAAAKGNHEKKRWFPCHTHCYCCLQLSLAGSISWVSQTNGHSSGNVWDGYHHFSSLPPLFPLAHSSSGIGGQTLHWYPHTHTLLLSLVSSTGLLCHVGNAAEEETVAEIEGHQCKICQGCRLLAARLGLSRSPAYPALHVQESFMTFYTGWVQLCPPW